MAFNEKFDEVFSFNAKISYPHDKITQATETRRKYGGSLFIDLLMKLLGVKNSSKIYPPRTNDDLRSLYSAILSATNHAHQQQTLIYYLLKDCKPAPVDDEPYNFAMKCQLPEKYRLFIEGLWHLDQQEYRRAMEFLTEPSLLPTFPDETLLVLLEHTSQEDAFLATAYYDTVQPPLATKKVMDAYFDTLSKTSLLNAFFFSRARGASTHHSLLSQLIYTTLSSTASGPTRSARTLELINLPFTSEEEAWFEECLLTGDARNCHGARDTVMARRLATGKVAEKGFEGVEKEETLLGRKIEGVNWGDIRESLEQGMGGRVNWA